MIYILGCLITIGKVQVDGVHRVEITQSVEHLSNTAVVELPRNVQCLNKGTNRIEAYIREGDNVEISLGYHGELHTEFVGYVRKIGSTEPLRIECEDEMYQLRKIKMENALYPTISLVHFLKKVAGNYKVHCKLDMTLENMKVENCTLYDVLIKIKEEPFCLFSTFHDGVLYVGLPYDIRDKGRRHTYHLGQVVSNQLDYVSADARNMRVKAISHFSGGKKEVVDIGSADGTLRTLHYYNKPKAEMQPLAEQELKRMKFTGYDGSVTGLGYPRTMVGDVLRIVDERYPDRDASYLIDEVVVGYGQDGYRRENKIKYKV